MRTEPQAGDPPQPRYMTIDDEPAGIAVTFSLADAPGGGWRIDKVLAVVEPGAPSGRLRLFDPRSAPAAADAFARLWRARVDADEAMIDLVNARLAAGPAPEPGRSFGFTESPKITLSTP